MKLTRREFLKATAATAAVASVGGVFSPRRTYAFNQSPGIPLFGTTLRGVGPGGIPVARPGFLPAPVTGVTHYDILISQFQDQILPSGFGKTTLWGYNPVFPLGGGLPRPKHLGGIIVGQKGKPIQITFQNLLFVNKHILPVDTTQLDPNEGVNRTAVHLHGGLVPWISDGGPFDWFAPNGKHGLSFLNNKVLNPFAPPWAAEYYYPLNQSARFMWYHDHAHGTTRLNAYAGLATALFIRDSFEAGLINQGLPDYVEKGGREIPLIFQDKIFVDQNINTTDPQWSSLVQSAAAQPGSLWYAHTYEPNLPDGTGRWDLAPGGLPVPDPSIVPEFFGDTMLVNGTAFPQATVEARRYRLRLLNACNARFLNLQLYEADGSPEGISLDANGVPTNAPFLNSAALDAGGNPTANWLQIGTEGGFLSKPALVPSAQPFTFLTPPDLVTGQTDPSRILKSLIVAPAERSDLLVDFSGYAGKSIILYSDAPAPFPSGDDRNDYFRGWNVGTGLAGIGNPVNGTTAPGIGPNTRVLMRFNVVAPTGTSDVPLNIDTTTPMPGLDPFIIDPAVLQAGVPTPDGYPVRFLSLNEYFDEYGRLAQIIGNADAPFGSPLENSATYLGYIGAATPTTPTTVGSTFESVNAGDTEVWEIYNTTGDVHPMHFHLVNVQVINRQLFDVANLAFNTFTGPVIPPEANELGWKETVPIYPGTVTRVIMKWDLASIVRRDGTTLVNTRQIDRFRLPITNGQPPASPRTGGHEYVWHCHILEHEEHDMMHALVVK